MCSRARTRRRWARTRVVPGARLAFVDGAPDVLAYPKDRAAYGRLCRILTAGNLRAPKGECRLRLDDLLEQGEGLQVVALPPSPHCGRTSRRPPISTPASQGERGSAPLSRLREAFGPRLWIGASLTYGEDMRGGLAGARRSRARSARR